MITEQNPDRRARTVALVGLAFELALTVFFALLMVWSQSQALRALTLLTAVGCTLWLYLVLIYHQRVLVREESLEIEQLRKERQGGVSGEAIFEVEAEQLLLARRRLHWMYRWMLPGFTIAIILELLIAALSPWSWQLGEPLKSPVWRLLQDNSLLIWFLGGGAFLSFLFSRYATGMARQREWRMLRAGASYLMGITLSAVALGATLAALHFAETPVPERVLAYVLRLLLLMLAAEITLNFVLDFYRPREPGEEPRPAFDSRLLGLFSEPGGIARSIAEAINYQFGFEVSSTWFYKLLERSVVPLIGFGVVTLFAASCLTFVGAEEEAVVERFGRKRAVLAPGLHGKFPWPIEITYPVQVRRIHDLQVGIKPAAKGAKKEPDDSRLWTNEHEQEPHLNVLVATPKLGAYLTSAGAARGPQEAAPSTRPTNRLFARTGEAVAVSLLRVAVDLQYQIRDAYGWLRTYENPQKMLEAIARREIMRHCASIAVRDLLGARRGAIEQELWNCIQQKADEAGLGVNIVFLGLQGVHPPVNTAEAFQDVIGAEQKLTSALRNAARESAQRLTEAAGNEQRARRLAEAISRMNALEADPSAPAEQRETAHRLVDVLFSGDDKDPGVSGAAGERIVQSRSLRWQLENKAHGWAAKFRQEVKIKNAAPRVYGLRKYLEALASATQGVRKYVNATQGELRTYNLNLQDSMNVPLDVLIQESK